MDIGLNSNFDIALDDRNDLPLLDGKAAFEQRLAIRTTAYFYQIVGSVNRGNLISLLQMQAKRVAKDSEGVVRVVDVQVSVSEDQPNTAEVTAIYATGDEFTFSLTE